MQLTCNSTYFQLFLVLLLKVQVYSTNQKKPNRERLTERVLFLFRTCSCSLSVSVLYLFRIRSMSVPYPFSIHSVLFCSHSVSIPSVSVVGTRSEERGFRELVYKISNTH